MKKEKKTEEIDSSAWMVTFTNLMILLLAFFIVMVNMATPDQQKKKAAFNSLLGSFGHLPGGQSPIGGKDGTDITMADSPFSRVEVEFENLRNVTSTNGLDSDVDIRMESERIILSLSNHILFEHGDYAITEKSAAYLTGIGRVFKEGPGTVELRGYAEKNETLLSETPEKDAVLLSTKRALSILHFLDKEVKLPLEDLVAHGFGISYPDTYSKGLSPAGRQGRVEIIVDYRQKIPYRYRVQRQNERMLDFKGFFFKNSSRIEDEKKEK